MSGCENTSLCWGMSLLIYKSLLLSLNPFSATSGFTPKELKFHPFKCSPYSYLNVVLHSASPVKEQPRSLQVLVVVITVVK